MDATPKSPLRDISFYVALLPLLAALAPTEIRAWVQSNPESVAPIMLWMATHGWLRIGNQKRAGVTHIGGTETNPPAGDPEDE